jgi:RNA-directed DNA polymerase
LIDRLSKRIYDAGVIRLVRAYLNAGIMDGAVVVERHLGTPQGGPLSPLLANVLLDEVDKALEARGYSFARYADDCVPRRRAGGAIRPRGHAAREMRAGPSEPAYRRRLQTTHCCCA